MDEQKIIHTISQIEHPEINSTLVDLGMVKDIQVEGNKVSLKLVLPMIGIPPVIRDFMINRLKQAVSDQGAVLDVTLAEMTAKERQRFFTMEHQNWRG
jgi:metal-sulfur cluster biosynthetic enzyme